MPGTWWKVFRIVAAAALVLVVAAGCGDTSRPQRSALGGVPPGLAHDWEGQATAIATAASAGDSCGALRLADSLRAQILASERKLPPRLRSPLVIGVNALVDRLTCTVTTPTTKPPPHKPPADKHHHDHGKHKHGDGGGKDK